MQARIVRGFGVVVLCMAILVLGVLDSSAVLASTDSHSTAIQTGLDSALKRTIGASSFTMHLPGTTLVYKAPDLTSVKTQNLAFPAYPPDASSYHAGRRASAIAYLDLALGLAATGAHGDVFEVRGDVTGVPLVLQRLAYYSAPAHRSGCSDPGTACAGVIATYWYSSMIDSITAKIKIVNGYVASETFVVPEPYGSGHATGTVLYSGINTSHL